MRDSMQTLMTLQGVVVWLLVTFGGAFCGSWVGAYLKKKGENYATHEDLGKLVKQMEAVTKVTEAIKTEISEQVWNRQRQWELRRDVLLEAAKGLGACHESIAQLAIAYKV